MQAAIKMATHLCLGMPRLLGSTAMAREGVSVSPGIWIYTGACIGPATCWELWGLESGDLEVLSFWTLSFKTSGPHDSRLRVSATSDWPRH